MKAVIAAFGIVLLLADTSSAAFREPGYRFKKFRRDRSRVEVVSVLPGHGFTVRPLMAYPTFSGQRLTSTMGRIHKAVAAVNGDFRILRTQVPKHMSVIRGEIMTSGSARYPGWVLAMNDTATQAWVRRPTFDVHVHQELASFAVSGWNAQQPAPGGVVAFTARGGGEQPGPDGRWPQTHTCSAILKPVAHGRGPVRDYVVRKLRKPKGCDAKPLQPPHHRLNYVVLLGHPVRRLHFGALEMTVNLGKGARNIVGGFPVVVRHGVATGKNCGGTCTKSGSGPDAAFKHRNPRTVVGVSHGCSDRLDQTKCKVFLVTVDGRQPSSKGVRFPSLAKIVKHLGAWGALNLDGGGSTTMWVRHRNRHCWHLTRSGCLMNNPPYGERSVLDGIGVVRVS